MGGFMPSVSASVGAQFSWGRNVDPETNTYNTITTFNNSYSVGGSLTLFDGAQTWNAFRKARLNVRRSDNALAIARDEKAIEVMEKYVDVVYNEASLRIAEDKLNDSRALLEKTRRMEELGEKGYPDVAQQNARHRGPCGYSGGPAPYLCLINGKRPRNQRLYALSAGSFAF